MELSSFVRTIADFPRRGATYFDLAPLYAQPDAFSEAVQRIAKFARSTNPDKLLALESGGLMLAGALAAQLQLPVVVVRRFGRLPPQSFRAHFSTKERDHLFEIPFGAVGKKERVLICDDIIASGTTQLVASEMMQQAGAVVCGIATLAEIAAMQGREALKDFSAYSAVLLGKAPEKRKL